MAMAAVLDLKLLKKDQLLLLLLGDKNLSMQQVLGKGRDGCARYCVLPWACSCLKAGVFVRSMCGQRQYVRMCNAWDTVLCGQMVLWAAVQCSCVLLAWVMLGLASLAGMRGTCARIARAGAGRRSARRKALRHLGSVCCEKEL